MKALNRTELKQASYARNRFRVTAVAGSTLEDFMSARAWVHVSNLMKPLDIVEVAAEDGAFYAELLVRSVTATDVKVAVIHYLDLSEAVATNVSSDDYEVLYRGKARWSILTKPDKRVIKDQMESKEAAYAELEKLVA